MSSTGYRRDPKPRLEEASQWVDIGSKRSKVKVTRPSNVWVPARSRRVWL